MPEPATFMLPPLALYVHMPWCVKKCPYCDFNSHGLRGEPPYAGYVDALLADLDGDLADFGEGVRGREIVSVFFGGGTPSLFAPKLIARFLDGARARMSLSSSCEITLETNPGTVEHGRFDEYLEAGVNRISFGVQSFDDTMLLRLGRIHSAAEAESAVRQARAAGIDNFNLDLMYALPQQTLTGALSDIDRAIALQPAHISHYQLTLEPNTAFAANPPPLPDDDAAWDMQEACQARLAAAGYEQYEVSAYARAGKRCAHNLNYWAFGDYLGIGAGAHGKISGLGVQEPGLGTRDPGLEVQRPGLGTRDSGLEVQRPGPGNRDSGLGESVDTGLHVRRRWKTRLPRAYLAAGTQVERIGGDDRVAPAELPFEFMLNALRLNDGMALNTFSTRTGLPINAIRAPLDRAIERGWLHIEDNRLHTTTLGRRFLNDVISSFIAAY